MNDSDANMKVFWMREKGVIQATWNDSGVVTSLVLGPPLVELPANVGPNDKSTNDEPGYEELLLMSS